MKREILVLGVQAAGFGIERLAFRVSQGMDQASLRGAFVFFCGGWWSFCRILRNHRLSTIQTLHLVLGHTCNSKPERSEHDLTYLPADNHPTP